MAKPLAIFLMGPTASGKTGLAVELSQRLPLGFISVDSALVFKDMDIGTAKPDSETLQRAPHALIDIIPPTDTYSAAQFRSDALKHMDAMTARGQIPMLVGGTMLYFKALLEGLSALPEADAEIRRQIGAEAENVGWPAMHAQLNEVDPATAARLKPSDAQRIERALEVYRITGQAMSVLHQQSQGQALPYHVLPLALLPSDRAVLHQRIEKRFDTMLALGFMNEVKALLANYPALHPDLPAMRCVGYRQALAHLAGEYDFSEFRDRSIFATRQLAKRQMTWLRNMPETVVLDCLSPTLTQDAEMQIRAFCERPYTA